MEEQQQGKLSIPPRKGQVYSFKQNCYLPIVPIRKDVLDRLLEGQSRKTVSDHLREIGLSKASIDKMIATVQQDITKSYNVKRDYQVRKNMAVLDKVIEKEMAAGHYGNVIKAITEINKMVGAYESDTNVQVNFNNGGFDFGMGGVLPQEVQTAEIIDITPQTHDEPKQ